MQAISRQSGGTFRTIDSYFTTARVVHEENTDPNRGTPDDLPRNNESTSEIDRAATTSTPGPLDAFLVRCSTDKRNNCTRSRPPRRRTLYQLITDRQHQGGKKLCTSRIVQHRIWSTYGQLCEWPHALPYQNYGASSIWLASQRSHSSTGNAITCIQFDKQSELLASVSLRGELAIHDYLTLQYKASARDPTCTPLLQLSCEPKTQAVRWSPLDPNLIATVSPATKEVHLYDLQYCQGGPSRKLHTQENNWRNTSGIGFQDVQFCHGGQYSLMAAAAQGQVFLWDCRASKFPRAVVSAGPAAGTVHAVQCSRDDVMLTAGTHNGQIVTWDLRGKSGAIQQFGGSGPYQHPVLQLINLQPALEAVPGLAEQSGIPVAAVHHISQNHWDENKLAFQLTCGWTGVVDVAASRVTHVHAPPPMWALTDGTMGQPGTRNQASVGSYHMRTGSWDATGSSFLVGGASPSRHLLHVLDFSLSTALDTGHSPADGKVQEDEHGGRHAAVTTSSAVLSLAVQPNTQDVVAGTENGTLLFLSHQTNNSQLDD